VPTRIQLFGLNLSQVLSSSLINETRLGYNRFVQTFTPLDAAFDPASIGLVTGAQSLPTITVTGFVSLGGPTNVPRGRVSSGYQFVDNLTWTRGVHTFKAGGEYRRAIVNSFNDTLARGRLNFNNLAEFLAGRVSTSGTAILRGATRRDTTPSPTTTASSELGGIMHRIAINIALLRSQELGESGSRVIQFGLKLIF